MELNERDIIYIFNHSSGNVEQCRVICKDFGADGHHLLYGLNGETHFVAKSVEIYASPEDCLQEEARKIDETYMAHYETFDSMEMVVLHALYAAMTGAKLDNLEIQAMVHRASEFMRVDISSSLDKYVKLMEKGNTKKTKKKEGCMSA